MDDNSKMRPNGVGLRVVAQTADQIVLAGALSESGREVSGIPAPPFPCLVWDHTGQATEDQRNMVAASLVHSGCRYAVCAGQNCDAWETAFDWACADHQCKTDHVMTTSHHDESEDDVAFFFVRLTNFDHHDFQEFLIVHVGQGSAITRLEAAVKRELQDSAEPDP